MFSECIEDADYNKEKDYENHFTEENDKLKTLVEFSKEKYDKIIETMKIISNDRNL